MDVDQAFALLRAFSRRHRLALRDLASLVINGSLSGAQLAEVAGHEGG
ncbi:ANTAR domain-containing protein [Nocardioides ungokensis]|nr:ANTAR domain-containing protein [Nocardioides ungokensis]